MRYINLHLTFDIDRVPICRCTASEGSFCRSHCSSKEYIKKRNGRQKCSARL